MANVITYNIDTAKKKLVSVKNDVLSIDSSVDYSTLNDEEFANAGVRLAENDKKLHDLLVEVQALYEANHKEFARHKESRQQTLFDITEYKDADGTSVKIGFERETKTIINRAQLDKETGVHVSVTGNNLDLYTKPSVRARKKKVIEAQQNGIVSDSCITTTVVDQCHFVFDDIKKGGE